MNDKNLFFDAFDAIDDELIAEAKSPKIRIAVRRKKIIISSVAACVAAVLVAIPSIKILFNLNDNSFVASEDVEIEYITQEIVNNKENNHSEQTNSENIHSAPQSIISNGISNSNSSSGNVGSTGISDSALNNDITIKTSDLCFTSIATNGSTTTYKKMYTPDIKYLYINPIPTDKYATIYSGYYEKDIDKSEAQSLSDKYFPKIDAALGLPSCKYDIDIDTSDISSIKISIHSQDFHNTEFYGIDFSVTNMQNRNIVHFSNFEKPLSINGETFSININQDDNSIINSLDAFKQKLFKLFNISFDSTKIIRHFGNDYCSYTVYLYDSNGHILNNNFGLEPYTDFISISFSDYNNMTPDTYYVNGVWYWSFRTENKSHSKPIAKKEILPLEKAKEYLQKGYVLAMGGCSLCQAEQDPIDFTDYDYVSFEYKGGFNINKLAIPYYTFYKNIGTSENGNMTFACTYVPAVEVEGYEEYFINKHNNHNQNSNNDYALDDNGE